MLRPLLWHLPISHFSEKVRWAFDWKRVPHRRRLMPPGLHPLGGLVLSRGRVYTMPILLADTKPGPPFRETGLSICVQPAVRWPVRTA